MSKRAQQHRDGAVIRGARSMKHSRHVVFGSPIPGLHSLLEAGVMNKDRVEVSAKEIKDMAKRAVGGAKQQADGKADEVAGKLQNAVGSIKDAIKEA